MNRDFLLWLVVGGLLIAATGGAAYGVYKMTRGIRNNNPGNIRHGSSNWQGTSDEQTDTAFVQFDDPVYGIRALTKLIKNYQTRYGLNTIREIINRWAPPTENDTGAYVAHVAREVGAPADQAINVENHIVPLVTTIIKHENGYNPYSNEIIRKGISLA